MTKEYFDKIEDFLSDLNNFMNNAKNCIEKINIISKINELVFWLQMYQDNYFSNKEEWYMALIKTIKYDGATVEFYDDFIPKNIEDRKRNLVACYDVVNKIASHLPKSVTKDWFIDEKTLVKMKSSGKYTFI